MGMRELHESLGKLKTTTRSFLLLWTKLSELTLSGSSNYIKTPFCSEACRQDIIKAIPAKWCLCQPKPPKQGKWMALIWDNSDNKAIYQFQEDIHYGKKFLLSLQTDLFFAKGDVPQNLQGATLKCIRVTNTTGDLKTIKTDPELGCKIKVVWSMGLIENLLFDPVEWNWGYTNRTPERPFSNYSAQIRYKTSLNLKSQGSRIFRKFTLLGLTNVQCKMATHLI